MFKVPIVSSLAAALVLGGCATLPAGTSQGAQTRTYPDSRASIWGRILAASARRSLFVRQADDANGVISVDRVIAPEAGDLFDDSISNWADCGSLGLTGHAVRQEVALNYVVRQEKDGRTTVTLNGRFRELRALYPSQPPHWVECKSTGVLERGMLEALYYDHPT
jgi:hypothetical protein